MNVIRAAVTETCNVYAPMPGTVDDLATLAGRLDDLRRVNLDHHVELIERAAGAGAGVVGLGELFAGPYFALRADAIWRELAEDALEGPTVTALRAVAARRSVVLVAPIYERDGDRRFNTAVVIDADGTVLGRYRKCHIPCGENEQGAFDERFYYDGSAGVPEPDASHPYLPVFETAVGRVGVSICYDRHFEGVVGTLARGGAQIIFSPAVTFGAQSRRAWELECQVDALRHGVYIGASNRIGSESPWNQPYFGGSHFAGPAGVLPSARDEPHLAIADLDLAALDAAHPSGWNLRGDARPEIY